MGVADYLAPGVKVKFGYWHSLNRKSRTWREKSGIVVRTVKHRAGTFYNQPEAVVRFDGNKSDTRIEISRLEIDGKGEDKR